MSADQLKAISADKNFAASCVTFTGVGGSGRSVVVTVDQRVVVNGSIAVDPNTCGITFENAATVKQPAAVVRSP